MELRKPDEDRDVANVAGMQITDRYLVADSRSELMVIMQRVDLLYLSAPQGLHTEPHPLCHYCPWPAPPQGWAHTPAESTSFQAADIC